MEDINFHHKSAIIKPDKDFKGALFVSIFLLVVALAAAGYYMFRGMQLTARLSEVESQYQELVTEKESYDDAVNDINIENSELVGVVNAYLRTQNVDCISKDIIECLTEATETEIMKAGPQCAAVSDNECPAWCGKEDDRDCCEADSAREWIQGRGCVLRPPTPTPTPPLDLFINTEQ